MGGSASKVGGEALDLPAGQLGEIVSNQRGKNIMRQTIYYQTSGCIDTFVFDQVRNTIAPLIRSNCILYYNIPFFDLLSPFPPIEFFHECM